MPQSSALEAPPLATRLSATTTLVLLCIAQLLAMSLWFAGTAVLPQLAQQWRAGLGTTAWLTLAVQLGFVLGALLSAIFNLADVFSAPRLLVFSTIAAALFNLGFAAFAEDSIAAAIAFRFLTGAALAGVYPVGMKILAGWFRKGRGLALGWMIGALSFGSALPHGIGALGGVGEGSWHAVQPLVLTSSVLAMIGAIIMAAFIRNGPFAAPSPPFDMGQVGELLAFRNRRLALANFGYLGHMWELYSMWGWMAVILAQSAKLTAANRTATSPLAIRSVLTDSAALKGATFLAIAIGIVGCVWAGWVSDRVPATGSQIAQRSRVTIIAMAVSALCCLLTAVFFGNVYAVMAISMVWGISVIADSAQFSAVISEVADPRYVGTALTLQVALGFLLTAVSIRVTAALGEHYGWRIAVASLAIGPVMGIWAMLRLQKSQGDKRMA